MKPDIVIDLGLLSWESDINPASLTGVIEPLLWFCWSNCLIGAACDLQVVLGFYKSGLVKDYNFRDIFEPHIWLFRMLNSIVEVCSVFSVFLSQTLFIIDDIVQPKKIQTSKPVWLLFFCGKLGENEHNIWAVVMYHKYLTSCPYDLCTKSYEDIQWICVRNMRK